MERLEEIQPAPRRHETSNELSQPVNRRRPTYRARSSQMTLDLAEAGDANGDPVQGRNSVRPVFLLIDFENVGRVTLASLPRNYRVLVFVGRSQNSIPFALTQNAQQLGTRLEWIKIEGDGRNNLDFHLAYYLGVLCTEHRDAEFLVLSRDKGFDPVIRHIVGRGHHCARIEAVEQNPAPAIERQTDDPHFEKAFKIVAGIHKKSRPRKRETLLAHLASISHRQKTDAEVRRIVDAFFARNLISEADNTLTYHF